MEEWINPKTRLPGVYEGVLVAIHDEFGWLKTIAYLCPAGEAKKYVWVFLDGHEAPFEDVSFWTDLPSDPECIE